MNNATGAEVPLPATLLATAGKWQGFGSTSLSNPFLQRLADMLLTPVGLTEGWIEFDIFSADLGTGKAKLRDFKFTIAKVSSGVLAKHRQLFDSLETVGQKHIEVGMLGSLSLSSEARVSDAVRDAFPIVAQFVADAVHFLNMLLLRVVMAFAAADGSSDPLLRAIDEENMDAFWRAVANV